MRTRRAFLLKQSLLHFFLAAKAVARPWHRFQALLLKLFVAGDAFAERAVFDPRKSFVNKLQQRAVVVRPRQRGIRAGVGVGGLVGEVHRGIFIRFAALLFRAGDSAARAPRAAREVSFCSIPTASYPLSGYPGCSKAHPKTSNFTDSVTACQISDSTFDADKRETVPFAGASRTFQDAARRRGGNAK